MRGTLSRIKGRSTPTIDSLSGRAVSRFAVSRIISVCICACINTRPLLHALHRRVLWGTCRCAEFLFIYRI